MKNNDSIIRNKRNSKINHNKDTLKDTTIDSNETSYKVINNNKKLNLSQSLQTGALNSIDEKYDKYKNLENPFTIPDIPINPSKERRTRIFHKINKERMTYQSKSVDNSLYDIKMLKRRNSHLKNDLFVDEYNEF